MGGGGRNPWEVGGGEAGGKGAEWVGRWRKGFGDEKRKVLSAVAYQRKTNRMSKLQLLRPSDLVSEQCPNNRHMSEMKRILQRKYLLCVLVQHRVSALVCSWVQALNKTLGGGGSGGERDACLLACHSFLEIEAAQAPSIWNMTNVPKNHQPL